MSKKSLASKDLLVAPIAPIPPLLNQKAELAARGGDLLLFAGPVGAALNQMSAMMGVPAVSISLIFPTKKPANMRRFLASLNLIISTVLDDQVSLDDFTRTLAAAIGELKAIGQEEQA